MIYKIKSQYSLDGVVIGYIEGEGKRSGMLKELLVANIRTDNLSDNCKSRKWFFRDEQ